MAVVSDTLFAEMRDAFTRWKDDYESGRAQPRNAREENYWQDNAERCPSNLRRGFIDPYKIPNFDRYPEAQRVAHCLWRANKRLAATPQVPPVKGISLRVYQSWDCFVRQMTLNLTAL